MDPLLIPLLLPALVAIHKNKLIFNRISRTDGSTPHHNHRRRRCSVQQTVVKTKPRWNSTELRREAADILSREMETRG